MRNLQKIFAFLSLALFVSVASLGVNVGSVNAAQVTCGDGTIIEYNIPASLGAEDVEAIRQEACKNNGGFGSTQTQSGPCDPTKSILGIPTWYKYLDSTIDVTGKCSPKIVTAEDALPIGLAVLEMMLRVAGLVAVVMVFIGGFKFIISQGSPDNAKAGRATVINALIGLAIVILSTGIVSFIGNRLG